MLARRWHHFDDELVNWKVYLEVHRLLLLSIGGEHSEAPRQSLTTLNSSVWVVDMFVHWWRIGFFERAICVNWIWLVRVLAVFELITEFHSKTTRVLRELFWERDRLRFISSQHWYRLRFVQIRNLSLVPEELGHILLNGLALPHLYYRLPLHVLYRLAILISQPLNHLNLNLFLQIQLIGLSYFS